MRRIVWVLAVAAISSSALSGQEGSTPQTARQALLEMFFSKTPGTLVKHLPSVTRAALEKSDQIFFRDAARDQIADRRHSTTRRPLLSRELPWHHDATRLAKALMYWFYRQKSRRGKGPGAGPPSSDRAVASLF